MAYSNEEQETVCVYDKIDNVWDVYTCVQKHITKLSKIAMPYWEEKEGDRVVAAKWKMKGNQVRFATEIITKMSDERREASRQRMLAMHDKQVSTVSK
ncbi:hypothetical protein AB4Z45_12630 [Paenibacillus sp. MCAF9]|uniref:hypothetical protein n=1 Tax=Paenibacillus sp. MCAF9 TaxID=3233046 RepID=UPI003F97812A